MIDQALADPKKFQELSKKEGFFKEYEQKQEEIGNFMSDWENATERLENAEKSKRTVLTSLNAKHGQT